MSPLRCLVGWHRWKRIGPGLQVDDRAVRRICTRCGLMGH